MSLLDHQVCDAFFAVYEGTNTTREERERLFLERKVVAV